MNIEYRTIIKIIQTSDLVGAKRVGLSPTLFNLPQTRQMYKEVLSYYQVREHYGRVPSSVWMEERFPGIYQNINIKESLEELVVELRNRYMQKQIGELVEDVSAINQTNPQQAFELIRNSVLRLQRFTPRSTIRILEDDADEIIQRANIARNAKKIQGIPYPWDDLNKLTQGIHQEDFVVLFGRPKSMKSWIGGLIAFHAFQKGNKRVLIYSCEMSTQLYEDRVACIGAELDYAGLKEGSWSNTDLQYFEYVLRNLKEDAVKESYPDGRRRSFKFISSRDDPNGGSISHIITEAEEFGADLIVVDAFYKLRDDRSGKRGMRWETQYNITQDMKGATQIMQTPIIGVTQRNRVKNETDSEENVEDIAFADAVGQEAEAVYRIKKDGKLKNSNITQLSIHLAASRETETGGFVIHTIPAVRWELVGWLDDRGKPVKSPLGKEPSSLIMQNTPANKVQSRQEKSDNCLFDVGEPIPISDEELSKQLPS